MDTISQKIKGPASTTPQVNFNWPESLAIQRLLNVVAAVIAEEYIRTARKNPAVFREIASGPTAPRNDEVKP